MGTVQPVVQSWRLHQPWLKTKVEKEARQTTVGLYPINEGVQPDVLQRGRDAMARQSGKLIWCMLYTEERLISVALKKRGGRVKV